MSGRPVPQNAPFSEAYAFLQTALSALALAVLVMAFVARAFTVEGPSMMPTLQSGERLLVDKITYRLRSPHRGEVIIFRFPSNPQQYFIKRVIGVPGDKVLITGGQVYINGAPLKEPYVESSSWGVFGPYEVPAEHFFVLGDNRNNSEDSRSQRVGFVPSSMIVGRALWRYWPIARAGLLDDPGLALASP